MQTDPEVTIVIPVYNEEAILHAAVVDLRERLAPSALRYEILLVENGSVDQTRLVAQQLSDRYPEVRWSSVPEPNYGKALKQGILQARGGFVICEEIDLCDTDFHEKALSLLRDGRFDMVIGSKLVEGAHDQRPLIRHAASVVYSSLLRHLLGFRGTDTHGLKAFLREPLVEIARACQVEKDVFSSEFVIRAYREDLRIVEIPVRVMEKRPASINLLKRVPNVLASLVKLTWSIRFRG